MDYREAGVDVEAGRAFVERIRNLVHSTHRSEVGRLGGFSGCFQLPGVQGTGFGFQYRWCGYEAETRPNSAITPLGLIWWRCV